MQLKEYILKYSFTYDIETEITELCSADELINSPISYDILFLDIRFGYKNTGIDIGEKLRSNGNNSIIVIISVLKALSLDSYRAEPFRFVVKPFSEKDIADVLTACLKKLNRSFSYIKIINKASSEIIRTDKILYIFSKYRKRQIICIGSQPLTTWQSLHELMKNLPAEKFAFSHKSYIVNLNMVDTVKDEEIILMDDSTVPIGHHFKDSFMNALFLSTRN